MGVSEARATVIPMDDPRWLPGSDDGGLFPCLVMCLKNLTPPAVPCQRLRFDLVVIDLHIAIECVLSAHGHQDEQLAAPTTKGILSFSETVTTSILVVVVALLLTMPFWEDAPSPQTRAVLNDEVGLVALAAALIPLVLKDR